MENASKALIIAGGVLVALLVISLGMYIIGRARTTSVSAEKRRLETITQEQINKFSQYSGNVYGSEVENCIRRMYTYNKEKVESEKITISVSKHIDGSDPTIYDGTPNEIISNTPGTNNMAINMDVQDRNDIYTGTISYKENGMIQSISFVLDTKN